MIQEWQQEYVDRWTRVLGRKDWRMLEKYGFGYLMQHESGLVVNCKAEYVERDPWVYVGYALKGYEKIPWDVCSSVKKLFFAPGERVQKLAPPPLKPPENENMLEYWHQVNLIKH